MANLTQVLSTILVAGGGGGVVAYAMLRSLGDKWLQGRFDRSLQSLRHEHDRQIEELKFRITGLLDRTTRLAAAEFEVLPEAWSLTFDAYVQTMNVLPGFRRRPDFSRASDEAAKRVLQTTSFDQWEIDELLGKQPMERNSYYSERIDVHELIAAKKAVQEACRYLAKNVLFIEPKIHVQLTNFLDDAWRALVDWELIREMRNEQFDRSAMKRADEEFRQGGERRFQDLENLIRERFWEGKQEKAAT